jgi:predicted nucleic acid-binding Zn ribbon protein
MKTCLECGDKLIGREDKKFCSDSCRNAYNNKINKDSNNFMRNINNRLRRNYRILSELNAEGKTTTTRHKLLNKGFDFEYFTNIRQTRTGNTYYFLYDQGYRLLDNDYFVIVRSDH